MNLNNQIEAFLNRYKLILFFFIIFQLQFKLAYTSTHKESLR